MSLLLVIAGVWIALSAIVLVAMSAAGRAAKGADAASAIEAARIHQGRDTVHLASDNPRPVTDEDQAVCPTCASLVIGAHDGDPCPACGTAVTELPRIRHHVPPAAREARRANRAI